MGFSLTGLLVSIAVLAPNLLLTIFPPDRPIPAVGVARVVTVCEGAGRVLCLTVPALTGSGWGLGAGVGAPGLAVPAGVVLAVCLLGYWALWARYLRAGRRTSALFDTVLAIPVPMAVLPVTAFAATAALLASPAIAAATALLAIGHIPTAVLTSHALAATD